jgi:hypothetical protein
MPAFQKSFMQYHEITGIVSDDHSALLFTIEKLLVI